MRDAAKFREMLHEMPTKLTDKTVKYQRCSTDHIFQQLKNVFQTGALPNLACSVRILTLQNYTSGMPTQIDYGTGLAVLFCNYATDSSVRIVLRLRDGRPRNCVSIYSRNNRFTHLPPGDNPIAVNKCIIIYVEIKCQLDATDEFLL